MPNTCATCGSSMDDVAEPNKKNAAEASAGATEGEYSPSKMLQNLKEGLTGGQS